jgi:hypothetical protein
MLPKNCLKCFHSADYKITKDAHKKISFKQESKGKVQILQISGSANLCEETSCSFDALPPSTSIGSLPELGCKNTLKTNEHMAFKTSWKQRFVVLFDFQ